LLLPLISKLVVVFVGGWSIPVLSLFSDSMLVILIAPLFVIWMPLVIVPDSQTDQRAYRNSQPGEICSLPRLQYIFTRLFTGLYPQFCCLAEVEFSDDVRICTTVPRFLMLFSASLMLVGLGPRELHVHEHSPSSGRFLFLCFNS
jgi:hypothetical protein